MLSGGVFGGRTRCASGSAILSENRSASGNATGTLSATVACVILISTVTVTVTASYSSLFFLCRLRSQHFHYVILKPVVQVGWRGRAPRCSWWGMGRVPQTSCVLRFHRCASVSLRTTHRFRPLVQTWCPSLDPRQQQGGTRAALSVGVEKRDGRTWESSPRMRQGCQLPVLPACDF